MTKKEIIIILYNNYFWLFITSVVLFVLLIIYLKSKGYKSYGKIGFLLFSVSITLWLSNGILKHYSDNTSNQGTGYIEETTGAINIVEQFAWDYTISIGENIEEAIKNGYGDELRNIIITEDVLINNDKINAMIAVYTIKNILYRCGNEGYDISKQPGIVGTLYNLGDKGQPHGEPKVGGAVIIVNGNKYVYGEVSIGLYNYLNSKDYMLCKYIDGVLELSSKNSALYVQTLEDKNKYCK